MAAVLGLFCQIHETFLPQGLGSGGCASGTWAVPVQPPEERLQAERPVV